MSEVWIQVEHPDLKDSLSTVTLNSFLNSLEAKGWEAVEGSEQKTISESQKTFNRVFGDIKPEEAPTKGPLSPKSKKAVSSDD